VALRQSAFGGAFSWVFYLPLALAGFPPVTFLACSSINTLYQFWIHTRAIGKLGPLEWVMNTPSHHRVHHACNPKYIDRNYAGVFIVWDRMFGSFKPEDEEPAFGITKPLRSWNPLWANLHYWSEMLRVARGSARWSDRLRVLAARPGWRPDELGGFQAPPEIDRASQRKFDTRIAVGLSAYALLQFIAVLVFSSVMLFNQNRWSWAVLTVGTLAVVWSLMGLARCWGRRWALMAEVARVVVLATSGAALRVRAAAELGGAGGDDGRRLRSVAAVVPQREDDGGAGAGGLGILGPRYRGYRSSELRTFRWDRWPRRHEARDLVGAVLRAGDVLRQRQNARQAPAADPRGLAGARAPEPLARVRARTGLRRFSPRVRLRVRAVLHPSEPSHGARPHRGDDRGGRRVGEMTCPFRNGLSNRDSTRSDLVE
jgi:hypothetical protein